MTHDNVQALDLCFEIEGLIALIIKREDDVPENVHTLLARKISELSNIYGLSPEETRESEQAEDIAQNAEFEQSEDADVPVEEAETEPEPEPEIEVEPTTETKASEAAPEPETEKTSIALTLNDKFRFKRELFGNNAAELSDALDVVNAVSSKAELEDYFYNDLCWDPENPDVKDFMEIASARFKS